MIEYVRESERQRKESRVISHVCVQIRSEQRGRVTERKNERFNVCACVYLRLMYRNVCCVCMAL